MTELKGKKSNINAVPEKVYTFLSDFNNFKNLMPEQITGWKSEQDHCSFVVQGFGELKLRIKEKVPNEMITIVPVSSGKIPFVFELVCLLNTADNHTTDCEFFIRHEMPAMISMMASRPLQNLVDILGAKLKTYCETNPL